jgi:hypothetical protein
MFGSASSSERPSARALLLVLACVPWSAPQPAQELAAGLRLAHVATPPAGRTTWAVALDPGGRAWVLEAAPEGSAAGDELHVLADHDRDGVFETRSVFARGLARTGGLELGFGGAWLATVEGLVFLADADADLVADEPRAPAIAGTRLAAPGALAFGVDGWLYGAPAGVGLEACERPAAASAWRFHPKRHVLEQLPAGAGAAALAPDPRPVWLVRALGAELEASLDDGPPRDLALAPEECAYLAAGRAGLFRLGLGPHHAWQVDLGALASDELVRLALHANEWFARSARLLLAERGIDDEGAGHLRRAVLEQGSPRRARAALWALHASAGLDLDLGLELLASPAPELRASAATLLLEREPTGELLDALALLALRESAPLVRRQLAFGLLRLPVAQRFGLARALSARAAERVDPELAPLLWRGVEPLLAAAPEQALVLARETRLEDLARSLYRMAARQPGLRARLARELGRTAAPRQALLATELGEAAASKNAPGREGNPPLATPIPP